MGLLIKVTVDPDPDPEATGAFLEDVESENVINDVDSTESMVVVLNNTVEDETPASVASLRSPAVPASSSRTSNVNLKTPTTVQEQPQEPEPPIQEPLPKEEPSSQKLPAQESTIESTPVQEPLIEKSSAPEPLTHEPRVVDEPVISKHLIEEPLNPVTLNENLSVSQSLHEEALNQEPLIEKSSIPEDLVVEKLGSVHLIETNKSQEPLTEEPVTAPSKKSVVSDVLQTTSSSYGEMAIPLVPQDENQNQKKGLRENLRQSSILENSPQKTVSFNPNPIITYPITVVEQGSTTVIEDEKIKPTPTPTGSVIKPPIISGPGLLPQPTDTRTHVKPPGNTCPKCGQKIDAADTKLIPTSKVWCLFMALFCFGCWWLSWFPFLLKCWQKPVEICPYCYRRLGRKPISSNSVQP